MGGAVVEGLEVEVRERVGYVTIDRPERRNALSQEVMVGLVEAFDRFDRDDGVWAVLITGAGEKAFSAGRDLKELSERDDDGLGPHLPMKGVQRNAFEAVYECRKPVVAAINGWAVGGGLELAMACDLRVAAAHAKLGLPESLRGMGANFGAAILPRLVPIGVANEMLYFGGSITAEDAQRWGLVNQVYPSERFRDEAEAYVRVLLERAPLTVRRYKAVVHKSLELPLSAALRLDLSPNPYLSEDRVEGVKAFVEKRAPRWQAR
jgi:enoyl-CoA hydratase